MFRFKDLFLTFPILGWINFQLNRFLTMGGKVVFVATFFFAAGASHLDSPVYMLCGASITLLFVSYLVTLYFRPELNVKFLTPEIITIGSESPVQIQISNLGDRPACDLQILRLSNEKSGTSLVLNNHNPIVVKNIKKETTELVYIPMSGNRRGFFPCPPIKIRSAFPFNLVHTTRSYLGMGKTAVVPQHSPLITSSFISSFHTSVAGDHNKSNTLAKQEFIGSREYVPGIDAKRWDYAAWARLATPYVCQYDDESNRDAVVIFDNYQAEPNEKSFDAALSLVLSLAQELHANGFSINRFQLGPKVYTLPANIADRQFREICLAVASAKHARQSEIKLDALDWRPNHLTIIVAADPDGAQALNGRNNIIRRSIEPSSIIKLLVQEEKDRREVPVGWQFVTVDCIESGEVQI